MDIVVSEGPWVEVEGVVEEKGVGVDQEEVEGTEEVGVEETERGKIIVIKKATRMMKRRGTMIHPAASKLNTTLLLSFCVQDCKIQNV